MIPDISVPVYHLGPVPIDPWGTLVCIGFVLGLEIARARALRLGLDIRDIVDGTVATVLFGFVGGHLFHVLAYHPDKLQSEGFMSLVEIWAGFSSFGGFLGATLGSVVFFKLIRRRPYWKHADVIMFGFPFGWIFGRLGCFLAKDHIGKQTTFFLAQQMQFRLEDRTVVEVRHNLGLYEALYTIGIAAVFMLADRRPRKDGFFLALWCLLYAPARFGFDFLRNTDLSTADVRWQGLTPAQWGCIAMFLLGVWLVSRRGDSGSPEGKTAETPEKRDAGPQVYSRTERRNWFRIAAPGGSQAILYGAEGEDLVRVAPIVDLSAGGLAIRLADDGVDPGDLGLGTEIQRLELRLIGAEPLICTGLVRNMRASQDPDDPALFCGIEFRRMSAPMRSTLINYVMRRERTMLQHRRSARARAPEQEPIRVVVVAEEPILLRVRDLSTTGVALLAESPLDWEIGDPLALRLELPGEEPMNLQARLARCEERPPLLLYGLAFQDLGETDAPRIDAWVRRQVSGTRERPHG